MNWLKALHTLQLNQDALLDDHVGAEPFLQRDPLVTDWYTNLGLHSEPALAKLVRQARLVCGFEQTRSEGPMHSEGGIDNSGSDPLNLS